jgi:hypothetical protein
VPRIVAAQAIDDGYVYWFERTQENLRLVSDFILFESQCCDFLSFGIGLHPKGSRISLRISGPDGGAEFLKQAMQGQVNSAAGVPGT